MVPNLYVYTIIYIYMTLNGQCWFGLQTALPVACVLPIVFGRGFAT